MTSLPRPLRLGVALIMTAIFTGLSCLPAEAAKQPGVRLLTPSKPMLARACKVNVLRGVGSLVELLVTCEGKSVVVSYSLLSKEYCDPKMRCYSSLSPIARHYLRSDRSPQRKAHAW